MISGLGPAGAIASWCGYHAEMITRVLIVDDHGVVAEGLRYLIESQTDMKVVGCLQDSREAVRLAVESCPDVVLMDHAMPELNGTEATSMICARCPRTRIIMLSMHSNRIHVLRALQAGFCQLNGSQGLIADAPGSRCKGERSNVRSLGVQAG